MFSGALLSWEASVLSHVFLAMALHDFLRWPYFSLAISIRFYAPDRFPAKILCSFCIDIRLGSQSPNFNFYLLGWLNDRPLHFWATAFHFQGVCAVFLP